MTRNFLSAFAVSVCITLALTGCGGSNNVVVLDDEPAPEPAAVSDDTLALLDAMAVSDAPAVPAKAPLAAKDDRPAAVPAKQTEPTFDGASVNVALCENYAGDPDLSRWAKIKVIRGQGRITAGALKTFAAAPLLTEFLWTDAVVADADVDALAQLVKSPKLIKVRLTGLQTPDGAFPIRVMQGVASSQVLLDLDLSGSPLTSAELKEIDFANGFKKLTKINLYQTRVGDEGVDLLLPLADRLTSLNLDDAGISTSSASKIARFSKLTFLHVGRSKIDDVGVAEFAKLTALKKIHITRSAATEEGAEALRKALPRCEVVSQPEN